MAYKQGVFLKFRIIIPILFCSFSVLGQKYASALLRQGDSLYNAKQYIKALECYREISREGQHTPAMWLKMAYVCEGLEQISETMVCLEKYNKLARDPGASKKILDLANKHKLSGYETAKDFWNEAWHEFAPWTTGLLMTFALLLLVLLARGRKKGRRSLDVAAAMLVVMALLLGVMLRADAYQLGIFTASPAYLMDAPSSGSNLAAQVSEGHRVCILGEHDVWLKVFWEKQELYIRKTAIRPI